MKPSFFAFLCVSSTVAFSVNPVILFEDDVIPSPLPEETETTFEERYMDTTVWLQKKL